MGPLSLLLAALLLAGAGEEPPKPAAAPEAPKGEPDPLGFPIRFDGETITRRDLLRSLGVGEETLGDERTLLGARNAFLFAKLGERVGRMLGVEVTEEEVRDQIVRRVESLGGEAKFYETLRQSGLSLERFKQMIRTEIMDQYVRYMVRNGIAPGGKLLPYDIAARPDEVETAWQVESRALSGLEQVRAHDCFLGIDPQTRQAIVQRMYREKQPRGWVEEEIERVLKGRIEGLYAEVGKGRKFEEAAAAAGVQLDASEAPWRALPEAPSDDPLVEFLRTAKPGSLSPPKAVQGGGYRFAFVLERKREEPRDLKDPVVVREFQERIRDPRRRKAEALLRLKALETAQFEPERVRVELRRGILAELGDAEMSLRRLGLH